MKRIFLLFGLSLLFCTQLYSQNRIDNFYNLMTSPNINKKSEILTLTKTDGEVIKTVKYKRNLRLRNSYWKDYWKRVGKQVDSLDIIDYKKDTVFIFQEFNGQDPFHPFTLIITPKDRIVVGYGSVQHLKEAEGWPFYYDSFHPILINPIIKWNISELSDVVSRYGTKTGEITGPIWITISKIIIDNYKKIKTSEINLDGMFFANLRNTNTILY